MKILYITTKATYGGVQTHIKQCANFMKERGHEVLVMAHSNDGLGLEKDLVDLKIPFAANDFLKNSFNPINGFFAIIKIRKTIKKFKPNLVSCHSSSAGFWGRLAVMNNVPVIFTAHGWGFTDGVGFSQKVIVKIAEKIVARFCKKIICVSSFDYNLALRHRIVNPQKIVMIHNGVETSYTFNNSKNLPVKLSKEKIPIIFVGRLAEPKKQEQLLLAFSLLPDEIKQKAEIIIIGGGGKKTILEKIVGERDLSQSVNFLGELQSDQVLQLLFQCKENSFLKCGIFALISNYEGLPRSILEGMMSGFAIIATDVGGVKEEVSADVGVLINKNDTDSIKKTLEYLLSNPEKIRELGENGKRKVHEEFSLNEMLLKTEEVYNSVV